MKALVTRVSSGQVVANNVITGQIKSGLAVFAGIEKSDGADNFLAMAVKIANLRIFEDEGGKFNYSALDKKYPVLCVSNFTLCADTRKGRRPSFENAMDKDKASILFPQFIELLKQQGVSVETGSFGDHMDISLNLNGPVNILLSA